MKEISLHILDIVQNSIAAKADSITVKIVEDLTTDTLVIEIIDNGSGMDKELAERIKDPFTTGRKTRRVGLGVPLLYDACTRCDGNLKIQSERGKGTTVIAWFKHSHIDRAPLGNMIETILTIVMGNPEIDFIYIHNYNSKEFCFDTREIKQALGEVSINEPQVLSWIKGFLEEGFNSLSGGAEK